jgi:hypothetical protein
MRSGVLLVMGTDCSLEHSAKWMRRPSKHSIPKCRPHPALLLLPGENVLSQIALPMYIYSQTIRIHSAVKDVGTNGPHQILRASVNYLENILDVFQMCNTRNYSDGS